MIVHRGKAQYHLFLRNKNAADVEILSVEI